MRRICCFVVMFVLLFSIGACGSASEGMSGNYTIIRIVKNGSTSTPADYKAESSNISVNDTNGESLSTMTIQMGEEFSNKTAGYISQDSEDDNYIRYKYTITNQDGNIDVGESLLLYYYPAKEEIEVDFGNSLELWFGKK